MIFWVVDHSQNACAPIVQGGLRIRQLIFSFYAVSLKNKVTNVHLVGTIFQAFSSYKLALVPRDGDVHRRESSAAAPARLTLTLLTLEPGQTVAAQGQLAVALEERGLRALRHQDDGENICDHKSGEFHVAERNSTAVLTVKLTRKVCRHCAF